MALPDHSPQVEEAAWVLVGLADVSPFQPAEVVGVALEGTVVQAEDATALAE